MGYYSPQEVTEITIEKGPKSKFKYVNACVVRLFRWGLYISWLLIIHTCSRNNASRMGKLCNAYRRQSFSGWPRLYFARWRRINYRQHDGCRDCLVRQKISFQQLLRNWAIVSVMNLVGAFLSLTSSDISLA